MNTSMKLTAIALAGLAAACASAPPRAPVAPVVKLEQKLAWILQLEDQRILKIDLPPPPAPPVVKGRRAAPPPPPPSSSPDLAVLVADPEARVRRRAALAVGRVGLPEGVGLVLPRVADPDAEVRQMAAFALGLIGVALDDGSASLNPALVPAVAPLTGALADADLLVRGRAAEALGQIGAREGATAIGKLAAEYARTAAVAAMKPDDERWPAAPEADAFRLALFALVRLRAYEPLASAVLDQNGRPVSAWWPVAYALQRIGDPRRLPRAGSARPGIRLQRNCSWASWIPRSIPSRSSCPPFARSGRSARSRRRSRSPASCRRPPSIQTSGSKRSGRSAPFARQSRSR
jgi:HEAT repeats